MKKRDNAGNTPLRGAATSRQKDARSTTEGGDAPYIRPACRHGGMQQVKKPARLALRQESKGSQQRNSCQSALGTHTRVCTIKRQSFIDMVFAALAAVVVPADILGGKIHRPRGFLMAGVAALAQRQRAPAEKTHAQHRQQQQQRHQLDGEREIHDKVNIAQRQRIVKEIYNGGTPLRLLAFRQAMHGRGGIIAW